MKSLLVLFLVLSNFIFGDSKSFPHNMGKMGKGNNISYWPTEEVWETDLLPDIPFRQLHVYPPDDRVDQKFSERYIYPMRVAGRIRPVRCSSTLVGSNLVITASHCLSGLREGTITKQEYLAMNPEFHASEFYDSKRDQYWTLAIAKIIDLKWGTKKDWAILILD